MSVRMRAIQKRLQTRSLSPAAPGAMKGEEEKKGKGIAGSGLRLDELTARRWRASCQLCMADSSPPGSQLRNNAGPRNCSGGGSPAPPLARTPRAAFMAKRRSTPTLVATEASGPCGTQPATTRRHVHADCRPCRAAAAGQKSKRGGPCHARLAAALPAPCASSAIADGQLSDRCQASSAQPSDRSAPPAQRTASSAHRQRVEHDVKLLPVQAGD
jgi:hypothetical protein